MDPPMRNIGRTPLNLGVPSDARLIADRPPRRPLIKVWSGHPVPFGLSKRVRGFQSSERGMSMADGESARFARRDVLKQLATVAGGAQLSSAVGATVVASGEAASAQAAAPAVAATPAGYQSLSLDEAAFVEALVNIMCPADHLTPNGVDCGLAVYMDRQLAGAFGQGER